MLYPCIFCVALLMDLSALRPRVRQCLRTAWRNTCNMFGSGCYPAVECHGSVQCGRTCPAGLTAHGLPKNVHVVPVIPVCI